MSEAAADHLDDETRERLDNTPFALTCAECDADGPIDYASAVKQGWTLIRYDDGPSWNFVGRCPDCAKERAS